MSFFFFPLKKFQVVLNSGGLILQLLVESSSLNHTDQQCAPVLLVSNMSLYRETHATINKIQCSCTYSVVVGEAISIKSIKLINHT